MSELLLALEALITGEKMGFAEREILIRAYDELLRLERRAMDRPLPLEERTA